MSLDISKVWLGTRDSYQSVVQMQEKLADGTVMNMKLTNPKMDVKAYYDDDEETEGEYRVGTRILEIINNVAIIHISGALVPNYAWYNEWFGLVSYEEIRDAFEMAVELREAGVTKILMDVTSGGGAVQGIEDISQFIKAVDSKVMPVHAHVTSHAYSAGYWLASSSRKITVNKMGSVGSIGVIMTLVNYKDMYDKAGVEFIYLRSGKFKALGQAGEEFTDETREHFMESVRTLHGFFEEHVISSRTSITSQAEKWNQGKTFFAKEAIKLGLADEITSYDSHVANLIEYSNNRDTFGENNSLSLEEAIMKFKFTEEQKAKLASGVALEDLGLSAEELEEAKAALSEGGSEPSEESVDSEETEASTDAEEESVDSEDVDSTEASTNTQVLALTKENGKLEVKLDMAQEKIEDLGKKIESFEAEQSALIKIAAEATSKIHVSLGKAKTDFSKLSAKDIVDSYNAAVEDFDKTFSGGQHSVQNTESREDQTSLQQPNNPINPIDE